MNEEQKIRKVQELLDSLGIDGRIGRHEPTDLIPRLTYSVILASEVRPFGVHASADDLVTAFFQAVVRHEDARVAA